MTVQEAMELVELATRFQARGVVGVDLCGDPMKGDVSIFREAFAKAKERRFKVTLHFGEIATSSINQELETLLSFQPDRLGHLCHVPDHLKQEILRRGCGIELCISCNVQAKLIEGGISDHHFGFWEHTACPLALCVGVSLALRSSSADMTRPTMSGSSAVVSRTSTCWLHAISIWAAPSSLTFTTERWTASLEVMPKRRDRVASLQVDNT